MNEDIDVTSTIETMIILLLPSSGGCFLNKTLPLVLLLPSSTDCCLQDKGEDDVKRNHQPPISVFSSIFPQSSVERVLFVVFEVFIMMSSL